LRFDSDPRALIDNLFLRALCRKPSAEETEIARHILAPDGKASVSGLEDLLWSILLHPEMQYLY
jgi:hypothetical protein